MVAPRFIGRKNELQSLASLQKKSTPSLVVVKGRRRVGKSRLINFFASKLGSNRFWDFAGLAPLEAMDAQAQRDHFGSQLANHLQSPSCTFQDWTDAFESLGSHVRSGDIILLDEI